MSVGRILERILTVGLERPAVQSLGNGCERHRRWRLEGELCPECRRERYAILIGFALVLGALAVEAWLR